MSVVEQEYVNIDNFPDILTLDDVAIILRITRRTVYRRIEDGSLETFGKPRRVHKAVLKKYMGLEE